MIQLFAYNTLKVVNFASHGLYLEGDEEWDNILLPNADIPEGTEVGDSLEVFLYFDSKDLIKATTKKPLAQVGEFGLLKVAAVESFGVFLDWGIEKQLFVPHAEQLYRMQVGESYVVFVYIDRSERVAATTRIDGRLSKERPPYKSGDAVDLLIYQHTDLGFKAVVDGQYSGMLFSEEHLKNVRTGQQIKGYVKAVRSDNKIDLLLQPEGLRGRDDLSEQILEKLKAAGGSLEINSKTPSETIVDLFGVSRKKFKVALGLLYKERQIEMDDDGIRLVQSK